MAIDWTRYTDLRLDPSLGIYDSRRYRTVDLRDDTGNAQRVFSDLDGNFLWSNPGELDDRLNRPGQNLFDTSTLRSDALANSFGRLGGDAPKAFDNLLTLGQSLLPDLTEEQLFAQAEKTRDAWKQRYGQGISEFQSSLDFTAETLNPLLQGRYGQGVSLEQAVPEWASMKEQEAGALQAAWQHSQGAGGWRGAVDNTLDQGLTQFILMSLAAYGGASAFGSAMGGLGVAGADAALAPAAFSTDPVTVSSVLSDAAVAENATAGIAGGFGDLSGTVGSELAGLNPSAAAIYNSQVNANANAVANPNGPGLREYLEAGSSIYDVLKPFLGALTEPSSPAPEQGLITAPGVENPFGNTDLFKRRGSGDPQGRLGSGLLLFNTGDPALFIP